MVFRSAMPRAVAGLSATALASGALVLGGATAAVAETSASCPQAASTRLFTANEEDFKLWLYQPSLDVTHLCFSAATSGWSVAGDLVVRGARNVAVPTVTPVLDADCPAFLHVVDPAEVIFRFGTQTGPIGLCVGVGTTAVGIVFENVRVPGADPTIDLYLDPQTTVGRAYCTYVMDDTSQECSQDTSGYRVAHIDLPDDPL